VALGLYPRERKASSTWHLGSLPAGVPGPCLRRPGPNAILGPALTDPRLALGHAWQCPR